MKDFAGKKVDQNHDEDGKLKEEEAQKDNETPYYKSPESHATEEKLGPFKYDQVLENENELEERDFVQLENNLFYKGQWNKNNLKEGRGYQIWLDGSIYEGYWKNNMANGKGRLIHKDGDASLMMHAEKP